MGAEEGGHDLRFRRAVAADAAGGHVGGVQGLAEAEGGGDALAQGAAGLAVRADGGAEDDDDGRYGGAARRMRLTETRAS